MTTKTPPKIWLSSPTMHGEELSFLQEACNTNWISAIGQNITEIERLSVAATGAPHAVALSCGTAALHLAVKLAGVKPGDRVFCSDMTFAATVNPVLYEGGTPVLIDAERDTWNMDPAALEHAFRLFPDTRVVVVTNLYGTPAKMDELRAVCEKHGAIIVEDAAESLGATYKGLPTGGLGEYGVISFNGNKIITGSSGGMLLTKQGQDADRARRWANQSREPAPWYQHDEIGYNYRISNLVAGIIRGQYPHLAEHIERKKAIYARYAAAFADLPLDMNPYDPNTMEPNFWLSCVTVRREAMCRQVRTASEASFTREPSRSCPTQILATLADRGIEGRPLWKPMHLQPAYSRFPLVTRNGLSENRTDAVGADLFERGLCLPSDIKMTPAEQDEVIALVRSCFAADRH